MGKLYERIDARLASGIETVAHLRENGRICVMFCAFGSATPVVTAFR